MSFDLEKKLESKREYRRRLAALPIAEKLAPLDALRERTLALRGLSNSSATETAMLKESPPPYGTKACGS
jgi:hypothetical protein